ncbi:MAG: DUF427 domain-containing protein [Thiohalocapsa sp.]
MANPAPGYATKPEHRVDLVPERQRVRVSFAGAVIADSANAIRVEETGHGPVHYLPEQDVRVDLLQPTDHKTHCPFKGDCSYWTIQIGSGDAKRQSENAVWAYRAPYDEAAGLAGHYAFYKTRVDGIEVL